MSFFSKLFETPYERQAREERERKYIKPLKIKNSPEETAFTLAPVIQKFANISLLTNE